MKGKGPGLLSSAIAQEQAAKDRNASNREALFQGSISPDEMSQSDVMKSSTSATMATMADAKLKLQERGEKLDQLSDKSAKLADASKEFSNMAKQLRQQQQQSWW